MKLKITIAIIILALFPIITYAQGSGYPHHDCDSVCDLNCQAMIEYSHENSSLPLHCSNGAPGTGAQANYCDTFYNTRVWHVQTCGNGGIDGNQTGCQVVGKLQCRKADGTFSYPGFDLKCYYDPSRGGLPVQSISKTEGICTWPNGGASLVMGCDSNGDIILGWIF